MLLLDCARRRLEAFRENLDVLLNSEFPYPHGKDLLEEIKERIEQRRVVLEGLTAANDPSVIRATCNESLNELRENLLLLGFILRSTNVRNGFECYAPLLRLSRTILGAQTHLILSSEWDYAPFVYSYPLPNYLLIGLPAPESANPLLIPLAGHELGHPLWDRQALARTLDPEIWDRAAAHIRKNWTAHESQYPGTDQAQLETEISARNTWASAYEWAKKHTQEIFCDLVGLRIFSESFLLSVAYLTAPSMAVERSPLYPSTTNRIQHLVQAATSWGVDVPNEYADSFEDEPQPGDRETLYQLSIADGVTASLVPDLIARVEKIATSLKLPLRDPAVVEEVRVSFSRLVPASGRLSLTDIVNGGWAAFNDDSLWAGTEIPKNTHPAILRDLVLKSLEVNEIESLLEAPDVAEVR